VLSDIAEDNGAAVLDMQEVFYKAQKTTEPKALAIDGIHPTNLGHKVMADAVSERIIFE
jgi:lysophospholipase L1-like esterase